MEGPPSPPDDASARIARLERLLAAIVGHRQRLTDEFGAAATLNQELNRTNRQIAAYEASTSWRITAPLRWLSARLRRPHAGGTPQETAPSAVPGRAVSPSAGSHPAMDCKLTVALVVHVFYIDLADEIAAYLANLPVKFTLLASVCEPDHVEVLRRRMAGLTNAERIDIRLVPNRGRDIGPLFAEFGPVLQDFDLICHIHTKKSLHWGQEAVSFRRHLLDRLLGSPERIASIIGGFADDTELGIVYPKTWSGLFPWAFTWLSNRAAGQDLLGRMGIAHDFDSYLHYPAGSMFWARSATLAKLTALRLTFKDFPPEAAQTDGTLQHAIERSFVIMAVEAGFTSKVATALGDEPPLLAEDDRNFSAYIHQPVRDRIVAAGCEADVVSVEIFGAVVMRPFATDEGWRAYLDEAVDRDFGLPGFGRYRADAAEAAWSEAGGAAMTLAAVYDCLADAAGLDRRQAERLMRREIDLTTRCVIPQTQVIEALWDLKRIGKRIVLTTDCLLDRLDIETMLMSNGITMYDAVHPAGSLGTDKHAGSFWEAILRAEGVLPDRIVHIGQDELLDLWAPITQGFRGAVQVTGAEKFARLVLQPRERSLAGAGE